MCLADPDAFTMQERSCCWPEQQLPQKAKGAEAALTGTIRAVPLTVAEEWGNLQRGILREEMWRGFRLARVPQRPGGKLFEAHLRQQFAKAGISVQPCAEWPVLREEHARRIVDFYSFTSVADCLVLPACSGSRSREH
jgi:hypothetical protein